MNIANKREIQQITSNNSSGTNFKDFMKLYKDYTKNTFFFLVNKTTLQLDNPLRFRKTYYEMTVSKKIKITDNKIEQNKAHYNLGKLLRFHLCH